ncbi:DUF302 domain-containing protein [Palleronia sp. LCG004]|uniref:DUF302 domain-containing protein n=1 Tax=Palleronia sp. LCG004 TaxID=3079304 RepID=UPI002941D5A5|nr:DUF302 domain-containing protein [Palleronia sp. LCG004]WOI57272.1 DUF302 domain-containing protein [Palleronia sp. LCG004]
MRTITLATIAALATAPALADYQRLQAPGTVNQAMQRLTNAVEDAGARIFATVDHAAGASRVDMELPDSQLLIFGSPELGTPVMQQNMLAGLELPLKMLVYADADGQTWVAYEPVEDMFDGLDLSADQEVLTRMDEALENFASAAAAN